MPPLYLLQHPLHLSIVIFAQVKLCIVIAFTKWGWLGCNIGHPKFLFIGMRNFMGVYIKSYGDYYVTVGVPVDV